MMRLPGSTMAPAPMPKAPMPSAPMGPNPTLTSMLRSPAPQAPTMRPLPAKADGGPSPLFAASMRPTGMPAQAPASTMARGPQMAGNPAPRMSAPMSRAPMPRGGKNIRGPGQFR